jgi:hypothetical protein
MSLRIENNSMSLEVDGRVVATARFSEHAAADRQGRGSSRPTASALQPVPPSQASNKARSDHPGGYQGVSRS